MLENESKFVFYILIILYHKQLFFLMTKDAVMLPHSSFHAIFPCTSGYISRVGIHLCQVKLDESVLIRLRYSRDTQEVENTQLLRELSFLFSSKGI